MRKKLICLCSITLLLAVAGCSSKKESNIVTTDEGKVTLCNYKGLSAVKEIYSVSEVNLEDEIKSELYQFVEYDEVDRASKTGDILSVTIKAKAGDTLLVDETSEPVEVLLGEEQYGVEVDKKLTGVKKGKSLSFKITYPKDYSNTEWAGKTVNWDITVKQVVEEKLPALTESFVKENLGYDSIEDMKKKLTEKLEKENAERSKYELQENLMQQLIDGSKLEDVSEELRSRYATAIEENYTEQASMYGLSTAQELYDMMGIEESSIQELEDNLVARSLIVQAIAKKEKLSVSDEEYKEGLTRFTEDYGFENTDALIEYYGEESIKEWLLEEKVFEVVEKNATITEEKAAEEQ